MEKYRWKKMKDWKDNCKNDIVPLKTMKYLCILEEYYENNRKN